MTVQLHVNGQDIAGLLSKPPKITDDLETVCRVLEFSIQVADGLTNYLGQQVQLYVGSERWFIGHMEARAVESSGQLSYRVYDPLYFLRKNPDDYYFKGTTATQRAEFVLNRVGIKRGSLASTGVVLPPALYKGAEGDKVIIDGLVKTVRGGGKPFWLRYNPSEAGEGATIFERKPPAQVWVFERGVNLISARYEESLEDHYNVVKLVNRDTGKTVVKMDRPALMAYGARTRFEEVDKDHAKTMDADAAAMLNEGNKVKTTINLEGVNADQAMPMFYSGDVVYIEEDYTGLAGAYHIRRIEQTIESSRVISLAMDVEEAPNMPPIEFEDAEKDINGDGKKTKAKGTGGATAKKTTKKAASGKDKGKGVQETKSAELQTVIDKYGL